MDPQGNANYGCCLEKHGQAVTLTDVLLGDAQAADILEELPNSLLHVLPGSPDVTIAEVKLMSCERREYHLRDALAPLLDDYDLHFDRLPTLAQHADGERLGGSRCDHPDAM